MLEDILFIEPVMKSTIWGGEHLKEIYNYKHDGNIGECWGISAHQDGDCKVKNMNNMSLSKVWELYKNEISNLNTDEFPYIVKFIDALDDLSIQVHPDDVYANKYENSSGKNECWYILNKEESSLVLGHYAKNNDELQAAINNHTLMNLLHKQPVHKDEFYYVQAGTLHAICKNTIVYEAQQSSNITYRFYDYERKDAKGNTRPLHIKQALDVVSSGYISEPFKPVIEENYTQYIKNEYLDVFKLDVLGGLELLNDDMILCSVIEGSGCVNGYFINAGDHFIITKKIKAILLEGNMKIMCLK